MSLVLRNFLSAKKTSLESGCFEQPEESKVGSELCSTGRQETGAKQQPRPNNMFSRVATRWPSVLGHQETGAEWWTCKFREHQETGARAWQSNRKGKVGIPQYANLRTSIPWKSPQEPKAKVESRRRGTNTRLEDQCIDWGVGNDGRIGNLLKKTQCERGDISQRNKENLFFQSQMDESHFLEEIRNWEHPPWCGEHPIRGESRRDFVGKSEGSPPPPPQDSLPDAGEAINDFLVHVRKLHIPPSRWTQSQTLLAERRIIPYSTEIHWRLQNYIYEFGCYARTPHRWLLEYRWIKRFVWFLDRFHSVYSVGRETSRRIYVVQEETEKTAGNIQARSFMARALDEIGKKYQAEGEAQMVKWKTETR